ncbi:YchJ family protein [Flavobacterium sp. GCM10027622]|uniref:YchJ family protein n=1 Tax=unclassified Flavobacterium TaxID=196869 RepID=UPI003614D700
MANNCYCGSGIAFSNCCEPFILGSEFPSTAEKLMRSRYSAYCTHNAAYLIATTHSSTRKNHHKEDILSFALENHWVKLEILTTSEKKVEFKAYYLDSNLKAHVHHEKSTFQNEEGRWFYVDGEWF